MANQFCRGIKSGGRSCGCEGYAKASKPQGFFTVCVSCGCCEGTHYKDENGAVKGATNKTIAEYDAIAVEAERRVVVYSSATDEKEWSTKEMRDILIENQIEVGQRGRLRPEQIAKAKELLNG